MRNPNTDTVLVNKPPTEYLPDRPPPIDAVHNVYELKTQPELIRYLHAAAGYPTKPTWLAAIKNKQFASWPGLTVKAVAKHYPESEETMKGHGRKGRSGLRSTKTTAQQPDTQHEYDDEQQAPIPKEHDVFTKVIAFEDDGNATIYSDQTGRFPKKIKSRQPIHHGPRAPRQQRNPPRADEKSHIEQNDSRVSKAH
jgi:hypothetical protein